MVVEAMATVALRLAHECLPGGRESHRERERQGKEASVAESVDAR